MALSKRLFAIFSMVEKGSVAADIGCDHGLLSIALIKERICSHVYACDLRKGPLDRAKQAIECANLSEQITPILSDGLQLVPQDCDTIIIAGMGFETIQGILERDFARLSSFQRIIVQSNRHVDELRRWISDHHFTILQEDIIEEDHFYEVICFSTQWHEAYDEDTVLFGIQQKHALFVPYWKQRLAKIEGILTQLPKQDSSYAQFAQLYKRIAAKLKECTSIEDRRYKHKKSSIINNSMVGKYACFYL